MTEASNNVEDEILKEVSEAEPNTTEIDLKAENQEAGCSKPKKRRRGKKKRHRSQDKEDSKCSEPSNSKRIERNSKNNDRRKRQKLLIRPTDVPKAPENSTQFIIDDHDECHLYFSFETPNPYKENAGSDSNEMFNDAALQDIDYEYESMQDLDNTAYYLQDFELSYSKVRYEETMRLTKPDLVTALENLESRVRELEHKMYEKDPGTALEQLQRKLLRLQEENVTLREEQSHLRNTVVGEDLGSDDLSQDSGSEHLQNSDNEQDVNELSFESSDPFSASDDNEHEGNFFPHSDEDDIEFDDNDEPDHNNEFEHDNSDDDESLNSVSSIIYGLGQEYDNQSNNTYPEFDGEFPSNSYNSSNSCVQNNVDEQSQNSVDSKHVNFETELSNNFPQESSYKSLPQEHSSNSSPCEKSSNVNEESLDFNSKQALHNSEQLQQSLNNAEPPESTEEKLQLIDGEQLHKNSNIEHFPDNSNSEVLLKMSNCQLDNVNNKQLQNNCNKQFGSDNCDERVMKDNSDKELQDCNSQEQLENVNSEEFDNCNS